MPPSEDDSTNVPGELHTDGASELTHSADIAPSGDDDYCHLYLPPPQPAVFKVLRLSDGSPLANAKVSVRCPDGSIAHGTTDGDGSLRVYGNPLDVFTIVDVVDPDTDKDHQLASCEAPVDASGGSQTADASGASDDSDSSDSSQLADASGGTPSSIEATSSA